MDPVCRKEFVLEGTEVAEMIEEEKEKVAITGEEVSLFYDQFVERTQELQPPSTIAGSNSSGNSAVSENTYFCEICDLEIELSKKTDHTLSVSHQMHRNKDRVLKQSYVIPTGNPGYQILLKNGWNEKGLGRQENGALAPVKTILKNDRLGIGIKPICPPKVTHTNALNPPRRANLYHRTIPRNLDQMDVFSALEALETTEEQKYAVSVRHRSLLLKRDRLKHNLLYQEIYK